MDLFDAFKMEILKAHLTISVKSSTADVWQDPKDTSE